MKTAKYNPRNLVLVLVAALLSAAALTTSGQVGPTQKCPTPRHIHQPQNSGAATPVLADFPKTPCSAGFEPNFGGTKMDRCFRHTFSFPPPSELCCQCIEGKGTTLTITYQAIFPINPGTINDTFALYSAGSVISGTTQLLYSGTVPPGPVTKTFPLKCSWLANNQLSFLVQDDTSVLSATIDVNTCCVKK